MVFVTNICLGKVKNFFEICISISISSFSILSPQFQSSLAKEELDGYAAAANVVEEVLSGIRTVFAFSGENIEVERYNERLLPAKSASRRKGLLSGIGDGILRFLFFGTTALIFWFGVQWALDDRDKVDKEYTAAVLMIVIVFFFGTINQNI